MARPKVDSEGVQARKQLLDKLQPTLTYPQPENQQVNSTQQGARAAVVELDDISPEVESGEAEMQVSTEGEAAELGMEVSMEGESAEVGMEISVKEQLVEVGMHVNWEGDGESVEAGMQVSANTAGVDTERSKLAVVARKQEKQDDAINMGSVEVRNGDLVGGTSEGIHVQGWGKARAGHWVCEH